MTLLFEAVCSMLAVVNNAVVCVFVCLYVCQGPSIVFDRPSIDFGLGGSVLSRANDRESRTLAMYVSVCLSVLFV